MPLHLVPRPLLYIAAVFEYGSIQGASRAIGIAASAIDRHIKSFEEATGAALFERHPRGMRPTAAGEAVLVLARRWQADERRLESDLEEMRGASQGSVRIAAMDSLANGVLSELVAWLGENHPRITLTVNIVSPDEAANELDAGTVDLAICFSIPRLRHQQIVWTKDLHFGCVVAPHHQLAKGGAISLSQIQGQALVAQSASLPIRQYLDKKYSWFFAENSPALSSNSLQLLKESLLQGSLAMITTELDVLPELARGDLVFLPISQTEMTPQTISIAVDDRRPLHQPARIINSYLSERLEALLEN